MRWIGVVGLMISLLLGSAFAAELKELRVCGDPDNLPFSNEKREGFENKIAEIVAQDLGVPLTFYWWAHQRGLVRNTLRSEKCDVLIGIPKGYDPVLWTKSYYRSAYVLVYPRARGFQIRSLGDPRLRQLKIGVHRGTPPHDVLAEGGIIDNVVSYSLFWDPRDPDPRSRPGQLLEDVLAARIDVGIVWGPLAGYFAKRPGVPPLELIPLQDGGPIPLTFEVSMGVKKEEKELKAALEQVIDRRQAEIRKVLDDYGVPVLSPKGGAGQ
jgi:mxaJ protein